MYQLYIVGKLILGLILTRNRNLYSSIYLFSKIDNWSSLMHSLATIDASSELENCKFAIKSMLFIFFFQLLKSWRFSSKAGCDQKWQLKLHSKHYFVFEWAYSSQFKADKAKRQRRLWKQPKVSSTWSLILILSKEIIYNVIWDCAKYTCKLQKNDLS